MADLTFATILLLACASLIARLLAARYPIKKGTHVPGPRMLTKD